MGFFDATPLRYVYIYVYCPAYTYIYFGSHLCALARRLHSHAEQALFYTELGFFTSLGYIYDFPAVTPYTSEVSASIMLGRHSPLVFSSEDYILNSYILKNKDSCTIASKVLLTTHFAYFSRLDLVKLVRARDIYANFWNRFDVCAKTDRVVLEVAWPSSLNSYCSGIRVPGTMSAGLPTNLTSLICLQMLFGQSTYCALDTH